MLVTPKQSPWPRFGLRLLAIAVAVTVGIVPIFGSSAAAEEVNVYSSRKEALIKPLLDRFSEDTGIAVKLVTGSPTQLIERMAAEGRNSPADILITADAGNLARAKEAGLLQTSDSSDLDAAVPDRFRDPDKMWWGLSLRARVVVYATDRVDAGELTTYEDLADPKWSDRLLVRSSSNIYNQSLIASMISTHGDREAEDWARGLVANMARSPKGGDTDQIRAVAAGEGDIAIVNTYYFGRLAASTKTEDRDVVDKTRLFFPNQRDRGTHVNVSGAGIATHAPHPENAMRLLEYLASAPAQALFAELNHEIPVRDGVTVSSIVESWGTFKKDDLPLAQLGELNRAAIELADRAGWR